MSMLMQLRAQTQDVIESIGRVCSEVRAAEDAVDQVYPALRAAVDGTNDPALREVMESLIRVVDRSAEMSARYGGIQHRLFEYLDQL